MLKFINHIKPFFNEPISNASIVFFRIALGLLVPLEILHYTFQLPFMEWYYLDTTLHLKYPGFEWIPNLDPFGIKILLVIIIVTYLFIALGFLYRAATVIGFVVFTFLFLMERASSLNHWYLISILTFLMIWIPANKSFSLDVLFKFSQKSNSTARWCLYIILFQTAILYSYSGIAKLNVEWLNGAVMQINLSERIDEFAPFLQSIIVSKVSILFISIATVCIEILAPFLLFWKRTRIFTIIVLCAFHLLNFKLFNIGYFPFLGIILTLLFLQPEWPKKLFRKFGFTKENMTLDNLSKSSNRLKWLSYLIVFHFAFQMLFPLRHYIYKRDTLWSEEGELFAWRMFTAPKKCDMGVFIIKEKEPPFSVKLDDYFTHGQIVKTMRNPQMILQMAHHLGKIYQDELGTKEIEVHVKVETSLSGRKTVSFIDTDVDLMKVKPSIAKPYDWVLPPSPKTKGVLK